MPIAANFIGYIPPIWKKNPSFGEYIEYQVLNPATMKMERQRIRLTKLSTQFKSRSEFKGHVMKIISDLTGKLAGGWTPYGETQDVREFTPICVAIDAYIEDKARDLRKASMVSYKSVADILTDWLKANGMGEMASHLLNQRVAMRFMDDLLKRPKFNNNTYNTYLKKYRACFNWLVEHGYSKENPFDKIKTRMKQEKQRGLIPQDAREKVLKYVRTSEHPNYEIVMHLVFTSLIRPSEIERLQVRDVDLKNKCIHVPPEKAKTHKERFAPLSDDCIDLLILLLAKGTKPEWYLINSQYECGPKPCYHAMFKKHRMKIRKACKLPDDMQLYSLKDSGITELLESGLDALTVMKAADHHDLATTTKYASHRDAEMINKVRAANVGLEMKPIVKVEEIDVVAGHPDMSITKEYEKDPAALAEKVRKAKAL